MHISALKRLQTKSYEPQSYRSHRVLQCTLVQSLFSSNIISESLYYQVMSLELALIVPLPIQTKNRQLTMMFYVLKTIFRLRKKNVLHLEEQYFRFRLIC